MELNGTHLQTFILMVNLDGKDPVAAAEAAVILVEMVVPVVVVSL